MKEFIIAAIGGLAVAVVTTVATYVINYERIERPKMLMDAHKQFTDFLPQFTVTCEQNTTDTSISLNCSAESKSNYPLRLSVEEIKFSNRSQPTIKYGTKADFWTRQESTIDRSGATLQPGMTLPFEVRIDSAQGRSIGEPDKLLQNSQIGEVDLLIKGKTIDAAHYFMLQAYPEAANVIREVSTSTQYVKISVSRRAEAGSEVHNVNKKRRIILAPALSPEFIRELELHSKQLKEVDQLATELLDGKLFKKTK